MSSFAIEYFIPPAPSQSSFRRDYLFTNLSPSLFCALLTRIAVSLFRPFPFSSNNFSPPHSFYEVSLRQLARIYLVTIHPCDFFVLSIFLFSFTELPAMLLRKPLHRLGLTHQQF
jgi:hypothetical protein